VVCLVMSCSGSADAAVLVLNEPQVVDALRKASGGPEACFADKACVQRYLRANNGNVKHAAAALANTVIWRLQTKPAEVECSACRRDTYSHNLRVVGLDNSKRPVLYTCFSQALHRFNPAESMEHMTRAMEEAFAIMKAHANRLNCEPAEKCVWVVDFHGYSFLKDSDPRTAILAARLMAHYPERLGRCLMIDAPGVFGATWSAVRKVLNEVTASKVVFVRRSDGSLEADLKTWAAEPLKTWLLQEISENRLEASQAGRKAYWKNALPHDARAEAEFLHSPEYSLTLTSRLQASEASRGWEANVPQSKSFEVTNSEPPAELQTAKWGTLAGSALVLSSAAVLMRGPAWQILVMLLLLLVYLTWAPTPAPAPATESIHWEPSRGEPPQLLQVREEWQRTKHFGLACRVWDDLTDLLLE